MSDAGASLLPGLQHRSDERQRRMSDPDSVIMLVAVVAAVCVGAVLTFRALDAIAERREHRVSREANVKHH